MAAVKVVRTSDATMRRRDDATTRRRDDADDANDNADGEGGGGRTTRLPGSGGEDEDDCVRRATKALAAGNIRATRCAGSRRPTTQSSTIAGQWATTERAADKSKQQPTIGR